MSQFLVEVPEGSMLFTSKEDWLRYIGETRTNLIYEPAKYPVIGWVNSIVYDDYNQMEEYWAFVYPIQQP